MVTLIHGDPAPIFPDMGLPQFVPRKIGAGAPIMLEKTVTSAQ